MTTPSTIPPKFAVGLTAIAPLSTRYFQELTIEFEVANISDEVLLVEASPLKFEADTGATPNYIDHFLGLRLHPATHNRIAIKVQPTPLYKEYTNQFDVLLKYRVEMNGRLGRQHSELHGGFYLIINPPPPDLGEIFISFKQPEDQRLANILERYAKRGGFVPHLFMLNPALGADQWKSIEKLIKNSHSMFVLWGRRTDWGEGVKREVELCRRHRTKEVLLIEDGLALPELYHGTALAYQRYDSSEPARALSNAVGSLREQILSEQARRVRRK